MSAMSWTRPATIRSGSSGCEAERFAAHCNAWNRPSISGSSCTPAPRATSARRSSTDASSFTGPLSRPGRSGAELGLDVGDQTLEVHGPGHARRMRGAGGHRDEIGADLFGPGAVVDGPGVVEGAP